MELNPTVLHLLVLGVGFLSGLIIGAWLTVLALEEERTYARKRRATQ